MSEQLPTGSFVWKAARVLLPRHYRNRYGTELLRLHVERARGVIGFGFWRGVVWDVVVTAVQLRVDSLLGPMGKGQSAMGRAANASPLDALRHSFMLARRSVVHAPTFTIAVVLTLALGIGANSTMFAILDRLLFSPPPHITNADQVRRVFVYGTSPFTRVPGCTMPSCRKADYNSSMTFPDFRDLRRTRSLAYVAAFSSRTMIAGQGAAAERVSVELASASYFPLLGVKPVVGRFFTEAEDQIKAAEPTAVLSYGYWQHHFGGASSVLGQTIELGKAKYTIVGVAPRGFTGVDLAPVDAWVPLQTSAAIESGTEWVDAHGWYWMRVIARTKAGVPEAVAAAEATTHFRNGRANEKEPDTKAEIRFASVISARGPNPNRETTVAKALGGLALVVLLIACANVANLFLARSVQRRKQFAVQSALGVARGRLLLQGVCEALLLAAMAGVLAYFVASAIAPALFHVLLKDADLPTARGARAALMTGALALATVLLGGLLPALRASRVDVLDALRSGRSSLRASWARRLLLGAQAALSVIMLAGAGLFLRSLQRASTFDLGLSLDALAVNVELEDDSKEGALSSVLYQALERLQHHPLVSHAAISSIAPFNGFWGLRVTVPGADTMATRGPFGPAFYTATADYFKAMNIPLLRGRALTEADDRPGAAPVAVIAQSTARMFWRDKEALGQCMMIGRDPKQKLPCTTVVGIVGDVQRDLISGETMHSYYLAPHHPQAPDAANVIMLSAKGDPETTIPAIRAAVRASAPNIRFVTVEPVAQYLEHQMRAWKLGATLLTIFGILALIVAAAGVYSVLAFDVVQRRFELGVRAALGAPPPRLVRSVVARELAVTAVGVIIGLAGALALARLASDLLFHVTPTDPVVYTSVIATLFGVALLAAALPAWRATRVDPKIALTSE